MADISNGDNP